MQDKFITSALRHHRAQCIRDGKPGLGHVETLLQMQGDNPAPLPRKRRRGFKRNECSRAVLAILRDGQQTRRAIAERLAERTGVHPRRAASCADTALQRLKRLGMVGRVDTGWRGVGSDTH
jgi:hypothetical protein